MDHVNKSFKEFHQKSKFKHVRGLEAAGGRLIWPKIFQNKDFGKPKQILWNSKTNPLEFEEKSKSKHVRGLKAAGDRLI